MDSSIPLLTLNESRLSNAAPANSYSGSLGSLSISDQSVDKIKCCDQDYLMKKGFPSSFINSSAIDGTTNSNLMEGVTLSSSTANQSPVNGYSFSNTSYNNYQHFCSQYQHYHEYNNRHPSNQPDGCAYPCNPLNVSSFPYFNFSQDCLIKPMINEIPDHNSFDLCTDSEWASKVVLIRELLSSVNQPKVNWCLIYHYLVFFVGFYFLE